MGPLPKLSDPILPILLNFFFKQKHWLQLRQHYLRLFTRLEMIYNFQHSP